MCRFGGTFFILYMSPNYKYNDLKISEYLVLLVELHNVLTLSFSFKKELQRNPDDDSLKKSLIAAGNELRIINNKLLDYSQEFIQISDLLQNSKFSPQYLKIDSSLHTGYFNIIDLKLSAIRQQKFILNERLNKFAEIEN